MLTYTDEGTGSTIVLLHAFPLSRQMWRDAIKSWSSHYRILAPDLPGFGESPLARGDFSLSGCAREISTSLESLGVQGKIVLLGLSMGGYIAFEWMRQFPEQIGALVLAATHPLPDSEAAANARRETAEFVRREGAQALSERLLPKLLGATTLKTRPAVVQQVRELIISNRPEGIAQACYGLASRQDSTSLLREINVPTLILAGAEDALIPDARAMEMKEQIKKSKLEIFPACGHLMNLEQPQMFQEQVFNFLRTVA